MSFKRSSIFILFLTSFVLLTFFNWGNQEEPIILDRLTRGDSETIPGSISNKQLVESSNAVFAKKKSRLQIESQRPKKKLVFGPEKVQISEDAIIGESTKNYWISQKGNYWILHNYFRPFRASGKHLVTFSTIGDYTFLLDNLPILLKRWKAPISLTLYAPGHDFSSSLKALLHMMSCDLEARELSSEFLSVHFFFDSGHLPRVEKLLQLPFTTSPKDLILLLSKEFPDGGIRNQKCTEENPFLANQSYRAKSSLQFPINLARNVALDSATTSYVLSADLELYPSENLAHDFAQMIQNPREKIQNRREKLSSILGSSKSTSKRFKASNIGEDLAPPPPRVYLLPVFELDSTVPMDGLPRNKPQLLSLLWRNLSIPFHKHVCESCHRFPKYDSWVSEEEEEKGRMKVIGKVKRNWKYRYLEPFFIGKKEEIPLFDERQTWEGKRNKMSQGFILCSRDFDLIVMNQGFLIHRPGIKRIEDKGTFQAHRSPEVKAQQTLIKNVILPELKTLYGAKFGCTI